MQITVTRCRCRLRDVTILAFWDAVNQKRHQAQLGTKSTHWWAYFPVICELLNKERFD